VKGGEFVLHLVETSTVVIPPKEKRELKEIPKAEEKEEPKEIKKKPKVQAIKKKEPAKKEPIKKEQEKEEPKGERAIASVEYRASKIQKKIDDLIKDKEIKSVECPGPGKQLIVNRSGSIEPINITLNSEEIDDIVKKFSEKSKTTPTAGVLKVTIDNLNITAIISEFIGTRFMIQKK